MNGDTFEYGAVVDLRRYTHTYCMYFLCHPAFLVVCVAYSFVTCACCSSVYKCIGQSRLCVFVPNVQLYMYVRIRIYANSVKNAIGVARAVLHYTKHSMLAGESGVCATICACVLTHIRKICIFYAYNHVCIHISVCTLCMRACSTLTL